jgi:hypothetical protein
MIPFIIAGAIGFGVAKLFEKDDNKKFAGGGEAGDDIENYSDYDEFYNVVFDYIKRVENLTEEETKDICNVNESIIEAEFEGGSSPRFTGDVVLGYLSNERAYKNYAKGGEAGDEIIDLGNDFSIVLKKAYFTDGSYTYGCHLNYKGELFKYFVMIPNETKEGALENVYNYLKSLSSGQAHIDHPRKGQTLVFYKDRGASEMKMVFEGSDSFKQGTNFVNDIKDISSKKFAEGGEVVIYPTDSNGKTFKWINLGNKSQQGISGDISKKMGMVVRVPQGYNLFVLESETQNKKDYHILAQISTETGEIEMIKGKFNSEPSSKYQKYIDDLINKFNFSINKDNYADGGIIGIGRYSILAQHSNREEPLVMKRVNNRNEIAGMVDKVKLAFKKLGYDDVTIFVTDEETDDEVYNYAGGGEASAVIKNLIKKYEKEYGYKPSKEELNTLYTNGELSLTDKEENELLNYFDEYAEGGITKKRRRSANVQTGRTDRSVDKTRVGKPVGYRFTNSLASKLRKDEYAVPTEKQITKYIGKGIYKENRRNRSDRDRTVKL